MVNIVYVPELPKKVMIRVKDILLVGTGPVIKGDEHHERLCTEERK